MPIKHRDLTTTDLHIPVIVGTSAPAVPRKGDVWYEEDANGYFVALHIYVVQAAGSNWETIL